MSPYEVLYGQPCHTPYVGIKWGSEVSFSRDFVEKMTVQIMVLKLKMKEALNRQKSYADKRSKLLEFEVGDMVFVKLITFNCKNRVATTGKLQPRYMRPYGSIL